MKGWCASMNINKISKVQQYKSDVAFISLVNGVNDNLYFIPKYQRKFRWKEEQVKDLARSLVKGYPIPPIYAYRNDDGQLEILDGQQRIMSLFFYYISKFIDKKSSSSIDYRELDVFNKKYEEVLDENYTLVDMITYLDSDIEGEKGIDISYKSLTLEFKRKIDYTTITIIELRWDDTKEKAMDLQKIFKNLNSKGTLLTPQEVRNGVYNCAFYEMLHDLNNNNENWKKIRGRESNDGSDMEFLLRLCTVEKHVEFEKGQFIISEYHSKYADWMDTFSEYSVSMKTKEIESYKKKLEDFFYKIKVNKVLGLQKALLESLYVVNEKASLNINITDEVINAILDADEYKENSRQGMVQKNKMNERWKGVYEVLSRYDR